MADCTMSTAIRPAQGRVAEVRRCPSSSCPSSSCPTFDLPKFDLPKFDLPDVDLPTAVEQVVGFARDAAYVGVGLAVMTVERLQALQQQLRRASLNAGVAKVRAAA